MQGFLTRRYATNHHSYPVIQLPLLHGGKHKWIAIMVWIGARVGIGFARANGAIGLAIGALALSSTALAQDLETLNVERGDLLRVTVLGEDAVAQLLSGEFRVSDNGFIQYPVLGPFDVAGKTTTAVASALRGSIAQQGSMSGLPTVSIAEYAPVYLIGPISGAGAHAFRPGMTVFQLMVTAGGLPQSQDQSLARLEAEYDVAELERRLRALEVRRARLEAATTNTQFDGSQFEAAEVQDIVAHELETHAVHRDGLNARIGLFKAQHDTAAREISSLEAAIELHAEEVALLEEQLAAQARLAERGLTARSTLLEMQRVVSTARREALEFKTALFRAKQTQLDIELRIDEATLQQKTEDLERLAEVKQELAQAELDLREARARVALLPEIGAVESGASALGGRVEFTLLRRDPDGEYATVKATERTSLERGDIVRVTLPTDAPGSNATATRATAIQTEDVSYSVAAGTLAN